MVTPGMRWMASARFVSGNLPMSSAVMASTIPLALRLMVSLVTSDWRRPVTTISPRLSAGVAVASVVTAESAIAPEQYIAMSTAKGFIGRGDDCCGVSFDPHEWLDFFKVLPLPLPGTMFILCADVERRFFCKRFLKPVAGPILPLSI